jgi:predicted metal-binding membrane protein
MFALGFTAVWFAFGVLASMLQYALHNGALLTPAGKSASLELSAALFVLAGLYQWTPLKRACVSKCRSPMSFFLSCWKEGSRGYLSMGLRMGKYCLGCCWAMMLLMFALGVMNLLWMGILTLYMYIEKNWIQHRWFDRISGLVLVSAGAAMLALPWQ